MEMEEWKPVVGYTNFYEVSNLGRIRSVSRWIPCARNPKKKQFYHGRIIKPSFINSGYLIVHLSKGGSANTHLVHRLVATAWLPNPRNFREVNHIDGNKANNDFHNLEWVSSSDNKYHAHRLGLYSNEKPVKCLETGEIFKTQKEAALSVGVHPNSIGKAYLGHRHTCRGKHWKFL